jgi:flavin-dependent dehydrogenase
LRSVDNTHPQAIRIAIIGAGPAGTACALALQRLATETGRDVIITLIEGKQFSNEQHYNQCVGVLSSPLPELMINQLNLDFPHHLCQVEIDGYILHGKGEQITLQEDSERSYALRRVQFDSYMFEATLQTEGVVVFTENTSIEADVVVGAFGMDLGCSAMFARETRYQPPASTTSLVTKYSPSPGNEDEIGTFIHAFLPAPLAIEFGAITPKCDHLTVNIAGASVDARWMNRFLQIPAVQVALQHHELVDETDLLKLHLFKGRFPCSLAKYYYGDRYVIVGDASGLVRAFKGKGITSAVQTGIRAAETILFHGYSREAFHHYYRHENIEIIHDFPYGRWMRFIAITISRLSLWDSVIRAAKRSPALRSALFDAVSAHTMYKSVLKRALQPVSIWTVLRAMAS